MDAPTQTLDVADGPYDEEEEVDGAGAPEPWGRFFPLGKGFVAQGSLILKHV